MFPTKEDDPFPGTQNSTRLHPGQGRGHRRETGETKVVAEFGIGRRRASTETVGRVDDEVAALKKRVFPSDNEAK